MAIITFMPLIAKACGKFSEGFGFRCTQRGETVSVNYGTRRTKPNASELAHRALFKQVAAATRARLADESQKAADMIAFRQYKGKAVTLYGYVFGIEWTKAKSAANATGAASAQGVSSSEVTAKQAQSAAIVSDASADVVGTAAGTAASGATSVPGVSGATTASAGNSAADAAPISGADAVGTLGAMASTAQGEAMVSDAQTTDSAGV